LSAGRCCRRYCATAIRRRRPERRPVGEPVGWSHISHGTPSAPKEEATNRYALGSLLRLLHTATSPASQAPHSRSCQTCGPVEEDEPTVVLAHDREPGAQIRTQDLMLSERVAIESPHPGLRPWRTRTSIRGLGRDLISATSDLNRGPPGRDAGDSREPYPVDPHRPIPRSSGHELECATVRG